MILPITAPKRSEHQSSRPQGLILDQVYREHGERLSSEEEGIVRRMATDSPVSLDHLEGQLCEVSISHDGDFATAVALVPATQKPTVTRSKSSSR